MHSRTARGNRIGLFVVGLLLLIGGAALIAGHFDFFPGHGSSSPIYPSGARHFIHGNQSWLWPVLAAVAILVGLVFLRWLLVQQRTDRIRRIRIDTEVDGADGAGRTILRPSAFTDIVEDDIRAMRGVRRVTATLSGHVDAPQLWLRVDTFSDADLGTIRRRISENVLPDARGSLELDAIRTVVQLSVLKRPMGREVR